jgi:hypothetical protein
MAVDHDARAWLPGKRSARTENARKIADALYSPMSMNYYSFALWREKVLQLINIKITWRCLFFH